MGGVIILIVEYYQDKKTYKPRVETMDDMSWKDALKVGFLQCLAMIPGTSRSGATIIGGLCIGLSRKAATEFSFFLAIPTIFGATVYDLWKSRDVLTATALPMISVGFIVSFFLRTCGGALAASLRFQARLLPLRLVPNLLRRCHSPDVVDRLSAVVTRSEHYS